MSYTFLLICYCHVVARLSVLGEGSSSVFLLAVSYFSLFRVFKFSLAQFEGLRAKALTSAQFVAVNCE